MIQRFAEWKFLAVTASLVALLGVPTLASLAAPEEEAVPAAMTLYPHVQKSRAPASLPGVGEPHKAVVIADTKKELSNLVADGNTNLHFDFHCHQSPASEFKVDGAFVQLKGKDCGKGPQPSHIAIVNKTNGFTASVFLLDSKQYETDLIQLKNGENQISIQYENPSGQRQEYLLTIQAKAL